MNRNPYLPSLAILLALAACGGGGEETPVPEAAPPAEAPASDPGSPIGPISSREANAPSSPMDAPAAPTSAPSGNINFDLPAGWTSQPPTSNMRLAQAEIPGSGGTAQLVVFYFGPGGGGTVEANIQRWIDQMERAAGDNPQAQTFETNSGYKVTWIDVAGTLKPSMMGTGPTEETPNSRLLGGIVEGPGGPWFFKATGPDSTLAAEREAFVNLLKSVRGA